MVVMPIRKARRAGQHAWLLLGLATLLLAAAQPASAAELRWSSNRPFQIVANEKPMPDFLRELASSQNITAVIDPKVSGVISGKFSGPAQHILNSVCAVNGLTWYYDGAFLYIDLAADSRSDVLPIAPENASRIAETLVRLRISDERYPLSISESDASVHVTGPKRYVEMVRQAVKLADQRSALADGAEIRLFPLKYAWAADFKINRSGKETVIPGVANVLRSLYGRNGNAPGSSAGRGPSAPFSVGPNRQIKLRSGESINAPKIEMPGVGPASADAGGASMPAAFGNELPQFQADTRMNAVLVRDTPERMGQYQRLIESMDVRPRLIEIEVTIMDISSDTLSSLGIDWRLHGRHGDFQTGRGDRGPLTWDSATSEAGQIGGFNASGQPVTPLGSMLTAAIGNSARNYLLARVTALATNGDANFVARPKVMTLDNTEAVLENLSEFYVRVDGFQDAGLFSITAGTAVRVTPLIIEEKSGRGVMMSIDIVDGDLSSQAVDRIPIVRRRTVNTQALVDEGASLLIAGYSSEERTNATTGVPVLKDIPGVGNLFKYSDKKQINMERFYLLTPRLVVPGSAASAPVLPLGPISTPAPAPAPKTTPVSMTTPTAATPGE
ncbi:EscC/YscC/HrcC family type III secretion system outer membrane ring protein [Variovorax sp. WS11]|uniref:type III secretion system outer membrane ring subunit SctC n=1 Tax=Variovorax sp. WS11 TaxID=1105204 RepID=UPI000D0CDEA8|nr:type III secretion system outer membrane ring subunit SctC [Variovorax sp. WS11]NDZ16483.1 EscC/YscC/HrcC family type III secretion system outer membrane ring protein [Variovorax sp. WS11]PSL82406.1 EscC/YscC/HrcC family type III secretion system outer membrane ring protein [Variovorax sp. WS11]